MIPIRTRWARPIAFFAALAAVASCGLPNVGPNKDQIFSGSVQEKGDALLRPVPVFEGATQLAMLSAKEKFLVFGLEDVKTLSGGGRGTILMGLDSTEKLIQIVPIGAAGIRATGVYRNKPTEDILTGDALAPYVGKRARKGRQLDVRPKQPVLSPVF